MTSGTQIIIQCDKLPDQIKRDIDYMIDQGNDPEKALLLPESCLPKVQEYVETRGEDIEKEVLNLVLKAKPNEKIVFDYKDYPYIRAVSITMTRAQDFIRKHNISIVFTERMRNEILKMQVIANS